jgi:hypothetical protein
VIGRSVQILLLAGGWAMLRPDAGKAADLPELKNR